MVENFSWCENKRDNWREYVLSMDNDNVSEILGAIPSAWNVPPKSHNEFVSWLIQKINPQVTVELGVDYGYSSFLMSLNNKGKVFKYDAVECMLREKELDEKYKYILVNNYLEPSVFINASDAAYLITEAIPSPMGANLSALPSEIEAESVLGGKSGEIFNWEEIKNHSIGIE